MYMGKILQFYKIYHVKEWKNIDNVPKTIVCKQLIALPNFVLLKHLNYALAVYRFQKVL